MKIGDGHEDLPHLTSGRNSSYANITCRVPSRSQGNMDSFDGDYSAITTNVSSCTKSRAGSVDYGCSSRLNAPIIMEESKEEMDREDEEDVEIVAINRCRMDAKRVEVCVIEDGEAFTTDADEFRSTETLHLPPSVHSSNLPVDSQGPSQRLSIQSRHIVEVGTGMCFHPFQFLSLPL